MAKYNIKSETINVISVDCIAVQQNMIITHRVIDGNMDDVAKAMYKKQINFIVLNTFERTAKDVETLFTNKDNVIQIKENGYCVTQLFNKLGNNVSNLLTLTQTVERIA